MNKNFSFKEFFEKYKLQFPVWGILFILPFSTSYLFPHPSTSTKWFIVYIGIIVFVSMFPKRFFIPRWNRTTVVLLLALLGSIVLNQFLFKTPLFSCTTIDRLGFLVLVLYFYQYFNNKIFNFKTFSIPFLIVTPIILLDSYSFIIFNCNFLPFSHKLASVFGNINMLTQFIGFSIVFQLYHYHISKNVIHKRLISLLIGGSLLFLYFGSSRSAVIGIFFVFLASYLLKFISLRALLIMLALGAVGAVFALKGMGTALNGKDVGERWSLIKSAINLFLENPLLGIGPDHFQFSYVPFAKDHNFSIFESTVARSPHSEFLRFLVEQGMVTIILFFSFFGTLIYKNYKKISQIKQQDNFKVLLLLGTFLGSEMLFQFPIELPFPFFLFAAMMGYTLTLLGTSKEFSFPSEGVTSAIRLAIIGFFVLLTLSRGAVLYIEQNYPQDYNKASFACLIDPTNWNVCLRKARLELKNNKLAEGRKTLTEVVKRYPYNFFAIKLWYLMEYLEEKPLASCETAVFYGNIFNLETHKTSQFLEEFCYPQFKLSFPKDLKAHHTIWSQSHVESTHTS